MKNKKVLITVLIFLGFIPICNAQTTYNYWVESWAPMEQWKNLYWFADYHGAPYVYPGVNPMQFIIKTDSPNQTTSEGNFTITFTNASLPNGTTTVIDKSLFQIVWSDIRDVGSFSVINGTGSGITFKPKQGGNFGFQFNIASLKGQTPSFGIGGPPPIGNNQTLPAYLNVEARYLNLREYDWTSGEQDKRAEFYEFTLPANWTINGSTYQNGAFVVDAASIRSNNYFVNILPDYFTQGEIKIRALNRFKDANAGSNYQTITMNRGFKLTTYPATILFGDFSPKTYATTKHTGVTYVWKAPDGWQINGGGNTAEGLELNSVSITPRFCSSGTAVVQMQMKMNGKSSDWFSFPTTVTTPSIANTTVYQNIPTTMQLSGINVNNIQSITYSGNGVSQSNDKVTFSLTGNIDLTVSVLLNGCQTSYKFIQTINVKTIEIAGPSLVCQNNVVAYTIPDGATPTWSHSSNLTLINQTNSSINVQPTGNISDRAYVQASFSGTTINKDFWVGKPYFYLVYSNSPASSNTINFSLLCDQMSLDRQGITDISCKILSGTASLYHTGSFNGYITGTDSEWSVVMEVKVTNSCGTYTMPYTLIHKDTGCLTRYSMSNEGDRHTIRAMLPTDCAKTRDTNENRTYQIIVANAVTGNVVISTIGDSFDLNGLSSGMYVVNVMINGEVVIRQTVLKQ